MEVWKGAFPFSKKYDRIAFLPCIFTYHLHTRTPTLGNAKHSQTLRPARGTMSVSSRMYIIYICYERNNKESTYRTYCCKVERYSAWPTLTSVFINSDRVEYCVYTWFNWFWCWQWHDEAFYGKLARLVNLCSSNVELSNFKLSYPELRCLGVFILK